MKQKIIGLVSGTALFGGFVAAGILSAGEPTLLQCMALGAVALIGGAGAFYTYWADNEKAPDERQLFHTYHLSFYSKKNIQYYYSGWEDDGQWERM